MGYTSRLSFLISFAISSNPMMIVISIILINLAIAPSTASIFYQIISRCKRYNSSAFRISMFCFIIIWNMMRKHLTPKIQPWLIDEYGSRQWQNYNNENIYMQQTPMCVFVISIVCNTTPFPLRKQCIKQIGYKHFASWE